MNGRSLLLTSLAVLALSVNAGSLPAQTTPASDAALQACLAAVQSGSDREARSLASQAEAEYRQALRTRDDPATRVLLARVLVQCRVPHANMLAQGSLVGQANELLEGALAQDPNHWEARFALAMNHFRAPEFLGRTRDAIREFERLLEQQGDRTDDPMFAEPYLYLGDLYRRRNQRAEAVATWELGATLFPRHIGLHERLRAHSVSGGAPGGEAAAIDSTTVRPSFDLQGIVVAASGSQIDDPRSGVALKRLDVLTTPGGAADLIQALRTGPGTTGATEGSDLFVRGGDPAEAPVWIDGARIFYPGRYETPQGSVFGILDPAVLKTAFFSSGGFSARYGNALSGVLDVQTEDRPEVSQTQLAVNSVQAAAAVQRPIGEAWGAWGSVRATEGTLMLAMHGREGEFSVAPRALEAIGGLAWEPRPGIQLKATGLMDGDRSARLMEAYGHRGSFESRGENRLLGLSARAIDGSGRTAVRGNVSASSRTSAFTFGVLDQERTDHGGTARVDGEHELRAGARIRGGVEAALLGATRRGTLPRSPQLAPGSPVESAYEEASTAHLGGYLEAEASPMPRLAVVVGARADRLPGESDWTFDPRLALGYRAADAWTVRLGGGVFHQGRWRTRYQVPTELTPSGIPLRATHLVAGVEREGEPALKVEGYIKRYGEYVGADVGPAIAGGRIAGGDAIVRWSRQPRLNGWLTYSLLRGRLELEGGSSVPSALDVTHTLTAVGKLTLPSAVELGTTGRYATGRPFTRPGQPVHAERLPDYSRLDLRLTRYWNVRGRMLVSYLELLNALDRRNVSAYTFDAEGRLEEVPAFFRRTGVIGGSVSF